MASRVTTVSTKGQVVLPKALRDRHGWKPGTRLVVEDAPGGVMLRPTDPGAATRIEDVYGMLPSPHDRPITIEEMNEGVLDAVAEAYLASLARD